jgi:hypothetical protein
VFPGKWVHPDMGAIKKALGMESDDEQDLSPEELAEAHKRDDDGAAAASIAATTAATAATSAATCSTTTTC